MDITATSNKIYTNKIFNGETINYAVVNCGVFFIFIALKQLFKTFFSIEASTAVLVAFFISLIPLYFLEKKFVFTKQKNTLTKQILWYVFRCGVDFGFFKICDFVFGDILQMSKAFIFGLSFLMLAFFNYQFDKLVVFNSQQNSVNRRNGRLYKLIYRNRFVAAAMIISAIAFCFIYMIFRLFPFGDTTVLRMDLYHQYGPLFVELFDRVVEGKSFFYSWQSGGGSSFLGNYFNYLSSPLSAIIFLFDRKEMAFAITTLVAVKGILSAGTFTFYIKKSLNRHSFVSAAFGLFYAFCGYFLAYYWNIMWIDGMILLPIIVLGIENIINKGKPTLYIASLVLMFYCSYYIAFMICIFAILYFLIYYFSHHSVTDKVNENLIFSNKHSVKNFLNIKFLNRGFNFAFSSIFAAMICCVVLVPVFFILQACSATSDNFPAVAETYFDILNLISSHLAGLETTIRSSGDDVLPNIYSGILPCLLLPMYIANKKISIKEKAMYILLLVVFFISFNFNYANFVWHAFHFPNDLPYRFSFMYTFILLVMAFKAIMYIKELQYKDIAMIGMAWLFVAILFEKFPTNKISNTTIYISIALIIVWTAVLLLIRKGKIDKLIIGVTVVAVAFCEVVVADSNSFVFSQEQKHYVAHYDTYTEAIDYVQENDNDFYRTELCYLDTRMDPCLYGYNGMSTFSSMAYEKYSGNQYSLGMFGNRINSYTYNTQTPVYNMMYNIKYLMYYDTGAEPSSDYYILYHTTDDKNTLIYQNQYNLPIAYKVSSDVEYWINEEGNPFDVQSDFIFNATGISDIFVPVNYVDSVNTDVDCESVIDNGTFFFTKYDSESQIGSVDITIQTVNDSNLYVYITSPEIENINYYWNDNQDSTYQNINEPYILDLGKHNAGDEITISVDCGSCDVGDSYFEIYAYNIDKEAFENAYNILKEESLNVTEHNDTTIKGTITANSDGVLYTSIPYDEGWSVYIDGEKAEITSIGDCQLGANITKGEHTVEFKYTPKGFTVGLIVTTASLFGTLSYFVVKRKTDLLNMNKKSKINQTNI